MRLVEVIAFGDYDGVPGAPYTKWSGLFETPGEALGYLINKSRPADFLSIDQVLIHWVKVGKPDYSGHIHSCEVEYNHKEDVAYFNEWDPKDNKYIRLFSCRK